MFAVLEQATTSEIVAELKKRVDHNAGPDGLPLMVGTEELNSLMSSVECLLVNRYMDTHYGSFFEAYGES